jgi:periplasmic divalent cation tolerance protein
MAIRKSSDRVVFVTAANEESAVAIGRALVEERLAACANLVGPIRSIYRWKDEVEDAAEHLLIIKTRASLYAALEKRVKELHSYEVPEIIAVKIESGSQQYLAWIHETTAAGKIAPAQIPGADKRGRRSGAS